MPQALERSFDEEPLPSAVVLDCDFVVNVVHELEEFHDECYAFAARLYRENVTIVYCHLLRIEFWQGWRRAVQNKGLPSEVLTQPMLLPDHVTERRRLYQAGDNYLQDFLRSFGRYEIRVGTRLLNKALDLMAMYNLDSRDSCVAACAIYSGVGAIVSLDGHFRRVEGVELWNNHIPARRAAARSRGRPSS